MHAASHPDAAGHAGPERTPAAFWLLVCALGVSAGLCAWTLPTATWAWPTVLAAVVVAAGSALADRFDARIDVGEDTYAVTWSEVLFLAAIVFVDPLAAVVGRMAGTTVGLVAVQRDEPRKLAFNLASGAANAALLAALFHGLTGPSPDPLTPTTWLALAIATAAADGLLPLAIAAAIRLATGHSTNGRLLRLVLVGSAAGLIHASFALLVVVAAAIRPWALTLLVVPAVALVFAYRAYVHTHRQHETLVRLQEFSGRLSRETSGAEVLHAVVTETREALRATHAQVWLVQGNGASATLSPDGFAIGPAQRRPDVVTGVLATGMPVHGDGDGGPDALIAPLVVGDQMIGALRVSGPRPPATAFAPEDLPVFVALANHAAVSLRNAELIDRLVAEAAAKQHQAEHDALTGLANRRRAFRDLETGLRTGAGEGAPLSVALVDLDRFKEVNDTFGHRAGDLLLVEVADRITSVLPDGCTAARLGGDEFALLLPGLDGEAALALARAAEERILAPFRIDGAQMEVGASIGVATAPADGTTAVMLLQRADQALYAMKHGQRGGAARWDIAHDRASSRRLQLGADLRVALADGSIAAWFQPQADLRSGVVTGAEALARWTHDTLGPIPPDEFVAIAAEQGLIDLLTRHVLDRALAEVARWERELGAGLDVSVNVSARNLLDVSLPRHVEAALRRHGVPARRLTLEITETELMQDPVRVVSVLEDLHALGVRLSIDDFGTGYSSLSYLKRLPVDELKIDRSFVQDLTADPDAAAIARCIVDLAASLGLSVVAEGVEEQAVWDVLRAMGVGTGQGYHLARPLPPADFVAWWRARNSVATLTVPGPAPVDGIA